jgi:hypothetical protein
MRKSLLPMIASLVLCGAATAALIVTNANAAQSVRKPVMMIAQLLPGDGAGPRAEGTPDMIGGMMEPGARRGQMCKDMYARKVGEMAFLETKLTLTAAQEPLFARWKRASLDVAKRHEGDCAERREPGQRRNVVERLNIEETMLKSRLADINAERPSLTVLYASLNPAQKEEFGQGGMGGRTHGMMGMMGHHRGMGPGRMGHGPMGDARPAPPPK